jgi:integrase
MYIYAMEIRYHKKDKDAEGKFLLYVAIYGSHDTRKVSTGIKISSAEWDDKRKEPRGEALTKGSIVMADVLKAKRRLEALEQDVTPTTVKDEYDRKKREKGQDIEIRDISRKRDAARVTKLADTWTSNHLFAYRRSTQRSIKESITQFTGWLTSSGRAGIDRKDLSHDVIARYEKHLQSTKKLANSTHGKRMKHLKWFLKSDLVKFDVSAIKVRTFQKPIIALDLTELEALEAQDVSTNRDHQRAKDLFLLGCYTGQRISDLKKISKESVVNGDLRIRQTKTGKDVVIPLMPETVEILKRNDWAAPRATEQDLNTNIKLVCKDAGIKTPTISITNKAGLDVRAHVEKYKLITSHISSKTFISTVATERYKMSPPEIAAICGKSLKTLLSNYFSLPRESARQKMLDYAQVQMKIAK